MRLMFRKSSNIHKRIQELKVLRVECHLHTHVLHATSLLAGLNNIYLIDVLAGIVSADY